MYKEMPQDAMQPHDAWIIAFCPDSNSFFVTNQRAKTMPIEAYSKAKKNTDNYKNDK